MTTKLYAEHQAARKQILDYREALRRIIKLAEQGGSPLIAATAQRALDHQFRSKE